MVMDEEYDADYEPTEDGKPASTASAVREPCSLACECVSQAAGHACNASDTTLIAHCALAELNEYAEWLGLEFGTEQVSGPACAI